jgi:hypothetical protein
MSTPSKSKATAKKAPLKPLPTPKTVGEVLKHHRTQKELSLKQVELSTRIRGKYLVAIEADDYEALPHEVYTKGFLQSYADFLGLDGKDIIERYLAERGDRPVQLTHQTGQINTGPAISRRTITIVGVLGLLAAVGLYLFWQFSALTAAPKLTITNPDKDQVLYGSLITINGQVNGGADVYVNESPILSDANGNFSDAIALQDGVNAIRVTAKNRLGKNTTVTRNILAHVPKIDAATQLPTTPFDGVAANIQIKDATASVIVRVDGREVFNGTMLPGTIQFFKAADKIVISTTNAGATSITITNSVVATKSLGPSGPMNQPRNNLEFAKDTQFQ